MRESVRLHFVRHGQTAWNVAGRVQGQTPDISLTSAGRRQVAELASTLGRWRVGAIVSSDLARALETARLIAARVGLDVSCEPALREQNFGVLQGQLIADLKPEMAKQLLAHRLDPDFAFPGGESRRALYTRVAAFLDRLRARPIAEEVVLVTHGGPIRVAAAYLGGLSVEKMVWQSVGNGTVQTFDVRLLQKARPGD